MTAAFLYLVIFINDIFTFRNKSTWKVQAKQDIFPFLASIKTKTQKIINTDKSNWKDGKISTSKSQTFLSNSKYNIKSGIIPNYVFFCINIFQIFIFSSLFSPFTSTGNLIYRHDSTDFQRERFRDSSWKNIFIYACKIIYFHAQSFCEH